MTGVNERLNEQCRKQDGSLFLPFGTVNPKLPGWEKDLQRCAEEYKMPGIRVHPGYQNYTLDDPAFAEMLRLAAEHRLILQIACWMEDERHHNPRMIVPTVDASPVADLVDGIPGLHVIMLNTFRNPGAAVFDKLAKVDRISVDVAMLELIAGLRREMEGTFTPSSRYAATRGCETNFSPIDVIIRARECDFRATAEHLIPLLPR